MSSVPVESKKRSLEEEAVPAADKKAKIITESPKSKPAISPINTSSSPKFNNYYSPKSGSTPSPRSPPTNLSLTEERPSCVRLTSYVVGNPGKKHYQQDMPIICPNMTVVSKDLNDLRYAYVAVYDGHGGSFCSEYLRMNLHVSLAQTLVTHFKPLNLKNPKPAEKKEHQAAIKAAFSEAFKKTDLQLCKECASRKQEDGSCCIAAMIRGDVVWVANVGDSKAVLGRMRKAEDGAEKIKATALSKDHSPLLVKERERIEKAGGKVEDGRVNGRLGVARSFGDIKVKRAGVISRPDITKFTITNADKFMILACDGLWEVFSLQDAVDYVHKAIQEQWEIHKQDTDPPPNSLQALQRKAKETPLQKVCRRVTEKLVREAVLLRGAKDNVTVIVTMFGDGL